jgi:hypothetical protein
MPLDVKVEVLLPESKPFAYPSWLTFAGSRDAHRADL